MRIPGVLVFAAAALAACGGSQQSDLATEPAATVEARAGETFRMRPGTIARVGTDGLLIAFRAISEDSRCPTDVTCVWAGDAVARIQAAVGRTDWTSYDLHTTLEPQSIEFAGHVITLVSVEPARRANESVDASRYVITLRVD